MEQIHSDSFKTFDGTSFFLCKQCH